MKGTLMLIRSIWCLPVIAALLAQPNAAEQAKKDLERLQGTWTMAALEVDGKDVGAVKVQDTKLTIKGDQYTVKAKNNVNGCAIRLDPSKQPHAIEMIFSEPGSADKVHKGIYVIEGDTLKICRGLNADQERPEQFATWPNTGYFVVTWKRVP
jgi:uncharacterized protein (TIGR03067 family)